MVTPLPVGDLPGWRQIVAQDFLTDVPEGGFVANASGVLVPTGLAGYNAYGAGSAGGAKLTVYPRSWAPAAGGGVRTSNRNGIWDETTTLSVSGSAMHVRLHTEDFEGSPMPRAAAFKPVLPGGNYNLGPYGRYEYRIRTTTNVAGGAPTFFHILCLALNSSDWENGELDFIETDAQGTLNGWYHYLTTGTRSAATNDPKIRVNTTRQMTTWTIVTVEWTPTRMKWGTRLDDESLDQIVWHLDSTVGIPPRAMAVLFQMEPTTTTPAPTTVATADVDWIAIYDYDPTITAATGNRVRVSRIQASTATNNRVRLSRMAVTTAAGTTAGNRVRVSRVSTTTASPLAAVNRVRVSRVRIGTTTSSPGCYLWDGPGTEPYPVSVDLWDGSTLTPISDLPGNAPAA